MSHIEKIKAITNKGYYPGYSRCVSEVYHWHVYRTVQLLGQPRVIPCLPPVRCSPAFPSTLSIGIASGQTLGYADAAMYTQHSAPSAIALDIINANYRMRPWLLSLQEQGVISSEALDNAFLHFGLRRNPSVWQLFIKRMLALLGIMLFVSGLIFFMAWNWEDMHRFAKFAVLEAFFGLFAAYALIRWPRDDADGWRWDARLALLGAGFMTGGLLALYGQVYQTGADPWELFRAWTIMLVLLSLAGKTTVFWFMTWLTGSLWLALYLSTIPGIADSSSFFLYMGLSEFVILTVYEVTRQYNTRHNKLFDPYRWLGRVIGCTAIILLSCFAVNAIVAGPPQGNVTWLLIYLVLTGLALGLYYWLIPELVFIFLLLASLASVTLTWLIQVIFRWINADLTEMLFLGACTLCFVYAVLKIFLTLRNNILNRAAKDPAKSTRTRGMLSTFMDREHQKLALKNWLTTQGAATEDAIDAFYNQDEVKHRAESPWYVKVFVTIGVWFGSALCLAALTTLYFDRLLSASSLGMIGLVFCFLSIQSGPQAKFSVRAFSYIIGVCGLIYATFLFDHNTVPTITLLAMLFFAFWLLKPPFEARAGSFMGMIASLFYLLSNGLFSVSPGILLTSIKMLLYSLLLIWAVYFIVLRGGRNLPAFFKPPSPAWLAARLQWQEALTASVHASLIACAVLAIMPDLGQGIFDLFNANVHAGTLAAAVVITVLLAWHYPHMRGPVTALGLLVAVIVFLSPSLGLGMGLVFLAFHTGKNSLLAAACFYLSMGIVLYYYNLDVSLLHKSLILMGTGVVLIFLSFASVRLGIREKA